MSQRDASESGSPQTGGELEEVVEVNHYTGGEACLYECGNVAEFVVVGRTGRGRVTFAGCRSCLNRSAIYPIDNDWVDERTDQVRNS